VLMEGRQATIPSQHGEYADVNGVHMHFEVNGSGEPLVLLHGGFGGAHIFGGQGPELSARGHLDPRPCDGR
jgi:pimeloyl-ACP methyl ester carboxylesterase